ncbi:glycosyltransferase family 20-domain-containing protein [Cladochytrium replicatum]|nr:glycosyltransferase family 20-domain-containing protein [Cladochytrium replicatum]
MFKQPQEASASDAASFFPYEPLPASGGRLLVASLFLPYTLTIDPTANVSPDSRRGSFKTAASAENYKRARYSTDAGAKAQNEPAYWHIDPSGYGNIGLQNAVNSMAHRMNRRLWIGSLGTSTQQLSQDMRKRIRQKLLGEYDSVVVYLSDEEIAGHYSQFCKQVLWRPFHYQLSDYPKGKAYEERAWKQYVAVNQKFANVIASVYQPNDVVWVNDYHLMLVPQMLRQLIPNAMIGFFLHIPFPSSEIYRCLHVRKQILEGMLGADLIGFQTYSFMRHFLMTCTRLLSLESTPKGIQLDNTSASVGIFPIGINLQSLNERRTNPDVKDMILSLQERYAGKAVVIGRDKNDYVKGVRQKMLAFERFLTLHPEWVGKVVLIQVALSTTEANQSSSNVSDVVARINSRFGSIEYTPVVYLHQDISFNHYIALLTIADACLITSLRDGMNLTSHEYVVCQEEKRSPLIISEFAGTYGSFGAALRVNPWDTREVADAIFDALTMSEEDKLYRWKELYSYVSTNTAQTWVDGFVQEVTKVHEELQHSIASSIPFLPGTMVKNEYWNSNKRILFLGHDGGVVPVGSTVVEQLYGLLVQLTSDPQNLVYLVSSRSRENLDVFKGIANLGMCAEAGCFIKYAGKSRWENMMADADISWKKKVLEVFEYYTDRTPGSYIEQKEYSIVWHYGRADLNFSSWQAAECQNHIEQSLSPTYPIHVLSKKKRLEVMPRNMNKGVVVRRVLKFHQSHHHRSKRHQHHHHTGHHGHTTVTLPHAHHPPSPSRGTSDRDLSGDQFDFIMAIGDDRSDEYMFDYLTKFDSSDARSDLDGSVHGYESGHESGNESAPSVPPTPMAEVRRQNSQRAGSMLFAANGARSGESSPRNMSPNGRSPADSPGRRGRTVITVTVGRKSSEAYWHLGNVTEVLGLLWDLARSGKESESTAALAAVASASHDLNSDEYSALHLRYKAAKKAYREKMAKDGLGITLPKSDDEHAIEDKAAIEPTAAALAVAEDQALEVEDVPAAAPLPPVDAPVTARVDNDVVAENSLGALPSPPKTPIADRSLVETPTGDSTDDVSRTSSTEETTLESTEGKTDRGRPQLRIRTRAPAGRFSSPIGSTASPTPSLFGSLRRRNSGSREIRAASPVADIGARNIGQRFAHRTATIIQWAFMGKSRGQ